MKDMKREQAPDVCFFLSYSVIALETIAYSYLGLRSIGIGPGLIIWLPFHRPIEWRD